MRTQYKDNVAKQILCDVYGMALLSHFSDFFKGSPAPAFEHGSTERSNGSLSPTGTGCQALADAVMF